MSITDLAAWAGVATAVGTLSLAAATYRLARGAKQEVEAANAQAKASTEMSAASLRQANESGRQAAAAERALTVQTAPLLSDVPYGIPIVSDYRAKPNPSGSIMQSWHAHREPSYEDASIIAAYIDEHGYKDANARVPFRNVGNGVAIVQQVVVRFESGRRVSGFPSTPILPSGSIAKAELEIFPDVDGYDELSEAINNRLAFQVLVAYADASGSPVGAVRLDVAPAKSTPESDGWIVRQVHWADNADDALREPSLSSSVVPD